MDDKEYIMNLHFLWNTDKSYFSPLYNQRFGTNTVFSFFLWGLLGKEGETEGEGEVSEGGIIFGKRNRPPTSAEERKEERALELWGRLLGVTRCVKWDQK